ncbi:MAG: hypothetical protein H6Q90_2408 [Deltaproteobacteria bacterium]|nr:hypothetical protein [Deltaproteobacteria bacterium]
MATYREHDVLLELLRREQSQLLESITQLGVGDSRLPLDEVGSRLRSLAAAEHEVLYPAFARVTLRPEAQRLLDDCRGHRTLQLDALAQLVRTRTTNRLWKIRALQLRELVQHHAEQQEAGLVPVLRSQLPRALYRSLAMAFAARHAQYLHEAPRVAAAGGATL